MIRSAFILVVIAVVAIIGMPIQWLALRLRLPLRRWLPRLFHRICLALLGIRVTVRGTPASARPLLFVSNHSSWLDILVLGSTAPVIFIAKSEIARWPLFGLFAKLQRSIFVDRSKRHATGHVNRRIAARLAEGDPVVLFGEGTSSDGNRVMPFRSALLGALHEVLGESGRGYVQPVSVAYTRLHGLPMGRQHRAFAAYYGDVDLLPHLARVLREGAIDVTVSFGHAVEVKPAMDRKRLARATEDAVRRMTAAALAGRSEVLPEPVPFPAETR